MTEVRDPNTGEVTLVGGLDKNPNYLPRKHDINKWNSMVNNYGRDAVEGWWARAYQKGRPEVTDAEAAKWSKWYVRTVEEAHANRAQDLLEELMRGHDKEALKHSLIHKGGFSEAEAKKIMEDMFPTKAKDTGRLMASLKHRNTIDETHVETWKSKSGDTVQIGLNDFIQANAFDVVEPYLRRTASNVALAKHLDVYKVGDIANNAIAGKIYLELCNNYISSDVAKMIKGCILPKDTVVFAKIGEALKLNRRAITSCDCLIDNNAMGIAPKLDFLRIQYFYFCMKNLKMQTLAESTTVPSVRKTVLEKYEIEVPSLVEQEEIEKKLTLTQKIIEKRRQELSYLDEIIY
jgi:hypothetical protein